jgi:hypothetical protein
MAQTKPSPKRDAKPEVKPHAPITLTTTWAAVVLALLTVLFFHDLTLGGKTFSSPDAVAPVGFVRIAEKMLYQQHVYPLWNPFVFLGMPSFGSGAYNPLIYPPDWPLALVAKVVPMPDMTWLLIYYFFGALFFYLLAREWGARAEGALLGAVAFAFAPNLVAVGAHGHGSQMVDSAYLPLLVWLAARWMRRGNLSDLGWLALAGGFQFLRGHVQICFYTWMAVGLYAMVEVAAALRSPSQLPTRIVRALGIFAGAALAFGVAGFYNLPLKDYAQYSIRGGTDTAGGGAGLAYATQWSMALYELPAIVWPNFAGFGGATYWGSMPFTDYPNAYMGVVAVLLALPALALRGRTQVFALVLGAFAVLVSFGSNFPLYGFLYDHLPFFNRFRIPVMIILLFQLALALGTAWGWSEVLERGRAKARPRDPGEMLLLAGGALLLLVGVVMAAGGEGLRGGYVAYAMAHKQPFSVQAASAAFDAFRGETGRIVFVGMATVALAWLAMRGKLAPALASVFVGGLLLFSLWPISTSVMADVIGEPVGNVMDVGKDDVVDFLAAQGGWGAFRVWEPAVTGDNRLAGFGISTLSAYHPAKPRLMQDLRDGQVLNNPRWLALLNVKYIVLPQPLDPGQTPAFLKPVYEGSAAVYENLASFPRVTVVGEYAVVADTGHAAVDSVSFGVRDPGTFTYVTKAPGVPLGPVTGATATVTHYGLHDVDIDVNTPGAALVRLADQWYPDWKATVDGKPVEILRADHALRAVVVPAGQHKVAFRFASASIVRGLALSIGSIVVALLLLVAGAWSGRRARPEPAPAEVA